MLGKLGWRPEDFYNSTLVEIYDALTGWRELQDEQWQWQRYNTRELCFYIMAPHLKPGSGIRKPEDVFRLPMDEEIRKHRHKTMPRIEIKKANGKVLK